MTVTIDLPPQLESDFVATAEARGVSVGELMAEILMAGRTSHVITGAALVEAGVSKQGGQRLAVLQVIQPYPESLHIQELVL